MDFSNVNADGKNIRVCIIKELRVATAAIAAIERLRNKEQLGQPLNAEERKALIDYYMGVAELVIRATKDMSLIHSN